MDGYHTYYQSPAGWLKISCTEAHVTSLSFVDEPGLLPGSENSIASEAQRQLEAYFTGRRRSFQLPLRQKGSPFQEKVWQLLAEIPFGQTISYAALARRYGDLKAIRAVAAANGRNQLAIVVPCHRVIGTNRQLTGYAGGLGRKQWLLEHEARHHSGLLQINFAVTGD